MNAADVLIDLVSTPSVSGDEAAAVGVFLRHARNLGLSTETDGAGNGLAQRGQGSIHIMLLGHIDTVSGHIPVRIEDGVLHGRGSVDAKGPLAAMLIAAAHAELPEGVRLTVAAAVGEETAGSPGARALAPRYRPDACIIGEPSGWDGVTLGYKGRLIVRATATADASHSAGAAPSACDLAIGWWDRARAHVASLNGDRQGAFNTITATAHSLRSATDGLRASATLEAGFRLPPWMRPEELIEDVRTLGGDELTLDAFGSERAHATDRNDPVVRALSNAVRAEGVRPRPKLKTGTADMNVVAPEWRCPIAAYGPGDSSLDHSPEEQLPLAEFEAATRVLRRAIQSLANELVGNRVDGSRDQGQPASHCSTK